MSVCLRPPVSSILSWLAGPALSPAAHPPQAELTRLYNTTPEPDRDSVFALLSQRNRIIYYLSCFMCCIVCLHYIHTAHSWCPSVCNAQPSLMLSNLLTFSSFFIPSRPHPIALFLILYPLLPFFFLFHPVVTPVRAGAPSLPPAHAGTAINVTRTQI